MTTSVKAKLDNSSDSQTNKHQQIYRVITHFVMFLWGVAVHELDSHPDHYKGPEPRTLCMSLDPPPL